MQRRYPKQPIVGVAGIVFREDAVLLIRRGKEPSRGEWSLPGGAVEVGETPEEALRREIREETGLEVEVVDLSAVVTRIVRDAAGAVVYHYILLDFLCQAVRGTPRAGSDSLAVTWVPLSRLARWDLSDLTKTVITQAWRQRAAGGSLPPLRLVF